MSAVCSKCEHSGNIIGAAAAPRKVCVPISTHLRLGFALYLELTNILMPISRMTVTEVSKL
jgi:hypothetical protein